MKLKSVIGNLLLIHFSNGQLTFTAGGDYSGTTFTAIDTDQSLRVDEQTDEVGNSIGHQFGFSSDINS